ncbi:hypothetical protein DKY63_14160 [Pseudomonas putida]|uniref:Uncharacterized protein n=1 Tax=Pseudomonas putida TaxID=303 RepID=A0A2Z4RJA5_PSEPU|nr:hypothetical protein DKY63_14160 [Pseudomonas putida]
MVVNDDAGCQVNRGALAIIASRLAPTEKRCGVQRDCACSTNHPINSRNFGEGAGFSGKTR